MGKLVKGDVAVFKGINIPLSHLTKGKNYVIRATSTLTGRDVVGITDNNGDLIRRWASEFEKVYLTNYSDIKETLLNG